MYFKRRTTIVRALQRVRRLLNHYGEKYAMKKRILTFALLLIIAAASVFCLSACADGTLSPFTEKDLILYYKESAEGENYIFENTEQYDEASGCFNLTLEVEDGEYDFNAHFKTPSGQKWKLYADEEGKTLIGTKLVTNFKNGENKFYLVVSDKNETYQKTYVVRIDKKYLVKIKFLLRDGSVLADFDSKFNDFITASNGRVNENAEVVLPGGTTMGFLPLYPAENGYDFLGWACAYEEGKPVTTDLVFVPTMKAKSFICGFDANGGYLPGAETEIWLTYDAVAQLPVPQRTGYNFVGWKSQELDGIFTDENGKMTAPLKKELKGEKFVAQWKAKSITLTFDTDGGNVISPITQDYDTALPEVAAPEKKGYTFKGWKPALPATMPAEDTLYTAEWTINKCTIGFDTDGGNEIKPITQDYGTKIIAPANPTKKGYTFKGWEPAVPDTMPEKGLTVKAQWEINSYKVTFNLDGGMIDGQSEYSQKYKYGENVSAPKNPVKTGYKFIDWTDYKGDIQKLPITMDDKDVTFTAKWEILEYELTYVYGIDGKEDLTLTKHYGDAIIEPEQPTREGYKFMGWQGEKFETMPDKNLTYTAQWSILQFTVTFDLSGGVLCGEHEIVITKDYGTEFDVPVGMTKKDHTFVRWTLNGEEATPVNRIQAKNLTYVAEWRKNESTVTFVSDGATVLATTGKVGDALEKPETPSKVGYTFFGWLPDINAYPETDTVVTAQWKVNSYEITYKFNDGKTADATYSFDYDGAIAPIAAPEREGYTFVGWEPTVPEKMPLGGIIVTARWKANKYSISFDSDGGSTVATITQDYDTAVTAPANPVKKGYTFKGWEPALPSKMPVGGLNVKAKWEINKYSVTFDYKGGMLNGQASVTEQKEYLSLISAPEGTPERESYEFTGWKTASGDEAVFPYTLKDADVTFHAVWKKKVTITLSAAGGTINGSPTKMLNESTDKTNIEFGVPVREYYDFVGWIMPGGQLITGNDGICAELPEIAESRITFYAKWVATEYTITVTADQPGWGVIKINGMLRSSVSASVESKVTLTAEPADGYEFTGWIVGGVAHSGSKYTFEVGTVVKNVAVTAKFKQLAGNAISTEAQLRAMKPDGEYVLAKDITLTSEWTPVEKFTGTFDGRGHTISNLHFSSATLTNTGNKALGLFASIASGGVVKNLTVNASIEIKTALNNGSPQLSLGAIAGINNGTVENCSVIGSIKGTGSAGVFAYYGDYVVGGAVGHNLGKVVSVKSTVSIKINDYAGYSYPMGGLSVGGVVGLHGKMSEKEAQGSKLLVSGCYAAGSVEVSSDKKISVFVGGAIGSAYAPVADIKTTGKVGVTCVDTRSTSASAGASNHVFVGGSIGLMGGESVTRIYSAANVTVEATGTVRAAGICNTIFRSKSVAFTASVFAGSVTAKVKPSGVDATASVFAGKICGDYDNVSVSKMSNLYYLANATVIAKKSDSAADDATFTPVAAIVVTGVEKQGTASENWFKNILGFGSIWSYVGGVPKLDIE